MLKKSYILNFIIDAKFNIKNKIVVRLSLGVIHPPKETLLEIRGGNAFTA